MTVRTSTGSELVRCYYLRAACRTCGSEISLPSVGQGALDRVRKERAEWVKRHRDPSHKKGDFLL